MNATFEVTGLADLSADIARLKAADLDLRSANENAAEIVVDAALPHIPRRSGALIRSTRASATQRSGTARSDIRYAAAIHWGRQRGNVGRPPGNHPGSNVIAGRPYLWNAAQASVDKIEKEYRDAVVGLLGKIGITKLL